MAGANKFAIVALLAVVMMISCALAAEEADAPSPSMLTGAASMAVVPSTLAGFGSLIAFIACFFH